MASWIETVSYTHLDVYKRQVGDSLIRMQDLGNEAVRDYLQRKSAILDLDFMAVIGMDGTAVSTSEAVENLRELPGIRDSLAGRRGVSFLDLSLIHIYKKPST